MNHTHTHTNNKKKLKTDFLQQKSKGGELYDTGSARYNKRSIVCEVNRTKNYFKKILNKMNITQREIDDVTVERKIEGGVF